jgi:hypothetical protein
MSEVDKISIEDHRELVTKQRQIFQRLKGNPQLAALLVVNPALGLQEFGVELSQEAVHHVLRTRQYPPELRQRQQQLEQTLESALQEKPQPKDPKWVKAFLFEKLQLQPLDTAGQTPKYLETLDAATLERLQALRPKPQQERYPNLRSRGGTVVTIIPPSTSARRMNIDAALPPLQPACEIPEEVTLETLYFYKDSHPLVRSVLELGILQRQAFPIQSPDSFRQIKSGEKKNALYNWIKSVKFPESQIQAP